MTTFKLGKLAPKIGRGLTVPLTDYVTLPVPPTTTSWGDKLPAELGMMLNDQIGDCTCAAVGHAIQLMTVQNGPMVTIPDAAILAGYEAVSGYDPKTGANDNGAAETDVLNYWRTHGFDGHKIIGSGTVNHKDQTEVEQTIALLGWSYFGIQVPRAFTTNLTIWDVPKRKRDAEDIVGGHAIDGIQYTPAGPLIVSWGVKILMTWDAFAVYADEAHGVVSPEWVAANGLSPSGLNLAGLTSDLDALAA